MPNLFFELIYLGVVSSVHFRGAGLLAQIDAEALPKLRQNNSLINGWQKPERTADSKDFNANLCSNPMLLLRKNLVGPEIALARSVKQLEPRWYVVLQMIYQAARTSGADVHDFSNILDGSTQPLRLIAKAGKASAGRK